jgi:2'-5' RNA ligase
MAGLVGKRSAIVVPVRLPPALEAIRLEHVDNAPLGVPPHVTLLFPFVEPPAIDAAVLDRAGRAVGRIRTFDVRFRHVTSFEPGPETAGVVWLAPEPAAPFVALTESLVEDFPAYLPYGGIHDEVIPHLTLANVDVDVPALVTAARPHLPFRRRAAAAVLLVEDPAGRWRAARRLPLG